MARRLLQNSSLGTIHKQLRCFMKIRPVWCIHIVAFLFSLLILSVSAFSCYRGIRTSWGSVTTKTSTFNVIAFHQGHIIVRREFRSDVRRSPVPFRYSLYVPEPIDSVLERYAHWDMDSLRRFLSFTYLSNCIEDRMTSGILVFVPLWVFLLPSMTWMCGFYLFKLRQHIRARRAEKQTLGKAV